jgi:hypothetical protein
MLNVYLDVSIAHVIGFLNNIQVVHCLDSHINLMDVTPD